MKTKLYKCQVCKKYHCQKDIRFLRWGLRYMCNTCYSELPDTHNPAKMLCDCCDKIYDLEQMENIEDYAYYWMLPYGDTNYCEDCRDLWSDTYDDYLTGERRVS